jgi:D-alanyl-D-alanine carboxypeptidase/D-alanyl-D-alanine-endopeptidase (penicillin-binding protein 4)
VPFTCRLPLLPHLIALLCLGLPLAAGDATAKVDSLLASLPRGAQAGILVVDLRDERVVYERQADNARRMASLAKLLVAAAALAELGPQHRFTTTLYGLGPLQAGSLPGLGVRPGGDPCLDEHFTDKQPGRIFAAWAAQLKAAGVQRIDGDLVIDDRRYSGPIRPDTYPEDADNLTRWYAAPASAFAWNDNCIEVRVLPGRVGAPAVIETRPRSARISVVNHTRTVAKGGGDLQVRRAPTANQVIVSGSYHAPTAWFPMAIHSEPDLLAGDELRAALIDAGIPVSGTVRLGPVDAAGAPLARHESLLLPALEILNRRSQNFYGEQILRELAVAAGQPGSITAGSTQVRSILTTRLGLTLGETSLLDGSGLSYGNTATPRLLVGLLAAMDRHPHAEQWRNTLKVDERHGLDRALVKTGTLNATRGLAGYASGRQGGRYAFAIMLDAGPTGGLGSGTLRYQILQVFLDGLP